VSERDKGVTENITKKQAGVKKGVKCQSPVSARKISLSLRASLVMCRKCILSLRENFHKIIFITRDENRAPEYFCHIFKNLNMWEILLVHKIHNTCTLNSYPRKDAEKYLKNKKKRGGEKER
jgi:hypothetical protein